MLIPETNDDLYVVSSSNSFFKTEMQKVKTLPTYDLRITELAAGLRQCLVDSMGGWCTGGTGPPSIQNNKHRRICVL